jgi:hypothetical protein
LDLRCDTAYYSRFKDLDHMDLDPYHELKFLVEAASVLNILQTAALADLILIRERWSVED